MSGRQKPPTKIKKQTNKKTTSVQNLRILVDLFTFLSHSPTKSFIYLTKTNRMINFKYRETAVTSTP